MFHFMRKTEKEKEKKVGKVEKGEKKVKLASEDLQRLDEIRRSFKIGTRGKKSKLPSGIIADYSENFINPIFSAQSPTSPTTEGIHGSEDLVYSEPYGYGITHSESCDSTISSNSVSSLKDSSSGPAKPPRVAPSRTPPPIPSRRPPSVKYSEDMSLSEQVLSYSSSSRPPTSASSSSITPSFVTPSQSPSHMSVSVAKFYHVPQQDWGENSLPILKTRREHLRTINVERQSSGDFGFSLRRASINNSKEGKQEIVLYAEPSQSGKSDSNEVLLFPGDKLVAVNSVPVEAKNRDDVINLIRSSQYSVILQVLSNSLWLENVGRVPIPNFQKGEDGVDATTSQRGVWIVHKNGFVGGQILEKAQETGKCKVKLESGQVYEIDEYDIENANPEALDVISGLWNLNLINESSILHILRNRFHSSLPFTLSSHNNLLYLTKNAKLDTENHKFLRKVVQPFSSSQLHPNVYSLAFQSYRRMVTSKRNQSIVIHGQGENATKKEPLSDLLRFLSEGKGPKMEKSLSNSNPNNHVPFWTRLEAIEILIDFFCTSQNNQIQKGTFLYNLEFDLGGRLVGINAQVFTLDIERLYEGPYFTIIQTLHDLSVCPIDLLGPYPHLKQLRKELLLEEGTTESAMKSTIPFFTSDISKSGSLQENFNLMGKISEAFLSLGLGESFTKSVWLVFGAVYHLGHVLGLLSSSMKKNQADSAKCSEAESHMRSACSLLGLPLDRVEKILVADENEMHRLRNVMGFALGLYYENINTVLTAVNKSNSVGFRNVHCLSINIVLFGFSPDSPGRFGDLASNYINERLIKLIKEVNFDRPRKLYKQEGIENEIIETSLPASSSFSKDISHEIDYRDDPNLSNFFDVLPLLDSWPANAREKGPESKKGFLYLIDEAKEPARFLEKFESEFFGENKYRNFYSSDFRTTTLSICHFNGNRVVDYDVKKILSHAEVVSSSKFTNLLLQESKKDTINCMFLKSSSPIIGLCISTNSSDIGLRRASSIRKTYASTWKKKNASLNVKIQADYLMEILERTEIQFLHCLNPTLKMETVDLDMGFLRNQIRSVNLSECIRVFKSGYPRYNPMSEFIRKFKVLGSCVLTEGTTVRDRVIDIFNNLDISSNSFKIGNSMVFMKHWVLDELEQKRDARLEPQFIKFQGFCRGYLARRFLEKMKIRDIAIRCVQKNVRKLLGVRNWSWWKLYQQIAPLTRVQSSHEKLQSAIDELSLLKIKHEKSEAERIKLKEENEKFEVKINELSAELSDEQATFAMASEKLDQEMMEKQKLESQYSHLKSHCQSLENEKHQLELDLAYSMLEVNGDGIPEDPNGQDSLYRQRWERGIRELEIQKQRMKQREQDHLDQIIVLKKSLEKKCNDAYEEAEEQRQIVAQLKRRIQKLGSELSDIRCLYQEESSRAALLEKKQRRFDTELASLNTQVEKERLAKERATREKDSALIQRDSTYGELQSMKLELQMKESKLSTLESELEESSRMGGNPEQINALRKVKNDLSMKIKEQDEELDDLAGQVQSLEGAKIRLEMTIEQMKKENKREVQQREEEIEDLRNSAQKKVKALECQLEAEHEERTVILRAKQEFERKLFDLEELSVNRMASQEQVSRLKRELKRTRALLKDAQTMVEQSKNDVLNKGMLRQLRHQLEDSESQRTRVNRAKQKVEEELSEALHHLEEMTRNRNEVENMKNTLNRDKSQLQMQLEENEEQLAEVIRKYKSTVEQLTLNQNTLAEQSMQISELEGANGSLKETIAELNAKLESLEGDQVSLQIQKRFHMKIREIETRLELEVTTKKRLEGQVSRLKEHLEKVQEEMRTMQTREYTALDKCKKTERLHRESKDELTRLSQRETEAQAKRIVIEKQLESSELEISTLKSDLKLALQRIEDLTNAIKECEEVSEDEEDSSTESVNDSDNDDDCESLDSKLLNDKDESFQKNRSMT